MISKVIAFILDFCEACPVNLWLLGQRCVILVELKKKKVIKVAVCQKKCEK